MRMIAAAILGAAFTLSVTGGVFAHDIYTDLKSRSGSPCCGGSDCTPVDVRETQNGFQFFVHDKWIFLPYEQVTVMNIPQDSPEHNGHWCGRALNANSPYTAEDDVSRANGWHTYCAFVRPGSV